jgi:hypothetical protein
MAASRRLVKMVFRSPRVDDGFAVLESDSLLDLVCIVVNPPVGSFVSGSKRKVH